MESTPLNVCDVCGRRNPRCTFGNPRGLCGCWFAYRGAQPCSRDDDPSQHDRPRSGWVARALAGTLPAKVVS